MNKVNYDLEMQKQIAKLSSLEKKPRLLLHACCAPCASSVVERLKNFFDITLYFYNPNMDSKEEYSARAKEIEKLARYFGIEYIIEEYNCKEFLDQVTGLENEKEGGARCAKCFNLRLKKTAELAKANMCAYFATTLTVSPLKNCSLINQIGLAIESQESKYLVSDFKKKNGYIRSIELSKELELYRQNYCGCAYSKPEEL